MIENLIVMILSIVTLILGVFVLKHSIKLFKTNKLLVSEGIKLQGKVYGFQLVKDPDGNYKKPIIQYTDPYDKSISYFNSNYDKGKWFDVYEKGDEVEILYLRIEDKKVVKISNRLLFSDSYIHFLITVILFSMGIGLLIDSLIKIIYL